MAYEAVHSLLETLNQILKQSHHLLINRQIVSIHDEAIALLLHLKNNPENLEEQERIRSATSATREIIQHLISPDNPSYRGPKKPTEKHFRQLKKAAQKFKSTCGDAVNSVKIEEKTKDISPFVSSSSTRKLRKDVVVGLDGDLDDIKNRLTRIGQPSHLQVLSIVGTGGAGKTTLAKLAYNDKLVVKNFVIRAWVTVSHDYSVGNILSDLLDSLERGNPFGRDAGREIPMESLIRKHLDRGRFLVVLDDMCSKKAWNDLKTLFSNTNSRNWIMVTTRLHDVAAYVNSSSPVHTMRPLDPYDSWYLLKMLVFEDVTSPLELEEAAIKILRKCGGLPLSIVMMAGILSHIPKTRDSWLQIATNHGSLEAIISLSYYHLPDYMKECFLYMGSFPEDYKIRASELIKLWIAEGFLKCPIVFKTLEEEAAAVLENLTEKFSFSHWEKVRWRNQMLQPS